MENNKNKQEGLSEQVHSEFETSVGNSFDVVREEAPTNEKKKGDKETPLNQLPTDDNIAKKEEYKTDDPPKMDAPEEKKD